jgi:hypothetical protein
MNKIVEALLQGRTSELQQEFQFVIWLQEAAHPTDGHGSLSFVSSDHPNI